MAKKRRTGSVISVRRLSGRGVGNIKNPASGVGAVVPPLIGGGLAGAATVLIEHMATPTNGTAPSQTMMTMGEWAPLIGAGVGALGAVALYAAVGAPQGAAAAAGAVGTAGSLFAYKWLNKEKAKAGVEPPATANSTDGRRRRMMWGRRTGAIVPQVQPRGMAGRRGGTNAIVMEPTATRGLGDPRGETVSLGQVSPAAFGTPGFAV